MDWPILLGGVLVAFLVIYCLTGGADFGGGVWDLLARGPRREQQRHLIKNAIGPIWEANHVWLIVLIVILFADFPKVFSLMANALHLPLTLMLFGVVLRGSAFVFRAYDPKNTARWGRLFAVASVFTPIMLGICAGALSSGHIQVDAQGQLVSNFWETWIGLFPFTVGLFTLAQFAFLAAVYLCCQTSFRALQDDFRQRAMLSGVLVGALSFTCLITAMLDARHIYARLTSSAWSLPLNIAAGISAGAALYWLWSRNYKAARIAAGAQVTLVILGWAFAMYPHLIYPTYTVQNAAAPSPLPQLTLAVLGIGSLVLVPSFLYLYKVFEPKDDPSGSQNF